MGYVDLHAHVLPGLDDGSPDPMTSVAMIQQLAVIGYDIVAATPHQKAAQYLPDAERIARAYGVTRMAARPRIDLRLGAENFWDDVFFARMRDNTIPRYDDGRAFLFEIHPGEIPIRFEETLFELSVKGLLPVMAHPERYVPFHADLQRLATIGQNVALVVDLGAIAGYHGAKPGKIARQLVSERIAHAVASDVHTVADVRAAAEGIAWIKKKLGADAATRLLDENPRRILVGELPDA